MDIIKRLQLNKNPKDIRSGSIIGAKNIMLDPIGSVITNEYGFLEAFEAPLGFEIKGCIPCNDEVCIFCHRSATNEVSASSKIFRLKDDGTYDSNGVDCDWSWEGGEVIGTFAYNYKGELILAVSEINTPSGVEVPLKIWNVDKENHSFKLEEDISPFDAYYTIGHNGSLVCGVYTFFIRYRLSENNYTKWFQLTDDIFILNYITGERQIHRFLNSSGTVISANVSNFNDLLINDNLQSDKNININISINNNLFDGYQVGYIFKRNNEVLGRIYNNYSIDNTIVNVINNKFVEEVEISQFLEDPHQFYNVKNLINYNNRLYLSNYTESKNIDRLNSSKTLSEIAARMDNGVRVIVTNDSFETNIKNLSGILYYQSIGINSKYTISAIDIPIMNTTLNIQESKDFVKKYIFDKLKNSATKALYYFPSQGVQQYSGTIENGICLYSTISTVNSFDYNIKVTDNYFTIIYNGNEYEFKNYCYNVLIQSGNVRYWERDYDDINNRREYFNINEIKKPRLIYYGEIKFSNNHNYIKDINNNFNNNRTLIPGQIYNFYVHFVRKDLSCTQGYKIEPTNGNSQITIFQQDQIGRQYGFDSVTINGQRYFRCPKIKYTLDTSTDFIILPYFSINGQDQSLYLLYSDEYIGFFISYEQIERNSTPVVNINNDSQSVTCTNSEYIYNIDSIYGDKIAHSARLAPDQLDNEIKDITNKSFYSSVYKQKEVSITPSLDDIDSNNNTFSKKKLILYSENSDIYNKEIKTLYQLSPIVFKPNVQTRLDNTFMFVPGFYNMEKIITFDKELVISPVSTYSLDKEGVIQNSYTIKTFICRNFSHTPINALSVKQDFAKGAVLLDDKTYNNIVIAPDKLSDFLELKQAYTSKPLKSYTNHTDNFIDSFNKTIYRSDIISDESAINGFRHFNIENYKNIIENKGNIVNIVGVGLYMLVHTEYSLFVFDRNNQLTNEAQLQIPDVFDIDYKEVTPSGEGFGGLKDKEESILTKYGYIWFDRISKSIFIFDGKEIKPLSADIHILIKQFMIENPNCYMRFAEDYISNRLLVSIKDDYTSNKYITLSYSFDTNTFISLHDYTFDKNYKTYNNSYLFSKTDKRKLYVWNKNEVSYKSLLNKNTYNTLEINNSLCSYVDIIFNDKYEIPKVLEYISYIISRNNKYNFNTNIIDQYFNTDFDNEKHKNESKLYSGFKLFICTDLTFSGEIDISKPEMENKSVIDKPYWNNGIWNFNWFRENISKDVTNAELQQQNVNKQMEEVYEQHDNLYQSGLEKSDMRSLINGKYFIFRFVFERNPEDLNLRFETLDVYITRL